MSVYIKYPRTTVTHHTTKRVPLEFEANDELLNVDNLLVPVFELDGWKVLVKSLADVWNYPSTYHLMSKLIKKSTLSKSDFKKTDAELNEELVKANLIDNAKLNYYYIDINILANTLNHEVFYSVEQEMDVELDESFDKITLNQVFPQYGFIDSTLELKHSTFNCLTSATKYNYYKAINNFKHSNATKLFEPEMELFHSLNDHTKIEINNTDDQIKKRKPIGKIRKNAANTDPNNLDLVESVIPGQGFIQEFNVSHICKVPNYYITNQQQQQLVTNNSIPVNVPKREGKVSRNVQQLVFNNDHDYLNFSKYFYTKTYRGPGSGNYKDAALVNRVNKIPMSTGNKITKLHRKLDYQGNRRHQLHLKGLLPDSFNQAYTNYVIRTQRANVEDSCNMEMLHSTIQFNLLVNTYRNISFHTWKNYYKFKMIDFDQLLNETEFRDSDLSQNFLLSRFNLPHEYKEIKRHLQMEFREKIKKPLYYQLKMPGQNPQFLTNIEIIKLPNANEIGWDNLKKYRDEE